MTEERKSEQADEHVEDLDVSPEDAHEVKGGGGKKKTPAGDQQQYLEVKLENVQITSYQG